MRKYIKEILICLFAFMWLTQCSRSCLRSQEIKSKNKVIASQKLLIDSLYADIAKINIENAHLKKNNEDLRYSFEGLSIANKKIKKKDNQITILKNEIKNQKSNNN